MRSLLWSVLPFGLVACQSVEPTSSADAELRQLGAAVIARARAIAVAEAVGDRTPVPVAVPAVAAPLAETAAMARPACTVVALDPVVVQLVEAAVRAHELERRVVLENLANVDTHGFKRRLVRFGQQDVDARDGLHLQVPVFTRLEPLMTQGVLEITNRPLDLAIQGEGFLALVLPDGRRGYTRDGALQLNRDGKLVTGAGDILFPEITLPQDLLTISIGPDGRVQATTAGAPDCATDFGQITLDRFVNPAGLDQARGVLVATEASGPPVTGAPGSQGLGTLCQGSLERSNVELLVETMNLQAIERRHATLMGVLKGLGYLVPTP